MGDASVTTSNEAHAANCSSGDHPASCLIPVGTRTEFFPGVGGKDMRTASRDGFLDETVLILSRCPPVMAVLKYLQTNWWDGLATRQSQKRASRRWRRLEVCSESWERQVETCVPVGEHVEPQSFGGDDLLGSFW